MKLLVPIRYPLTSYSKRTLSRALEIAEERGASEIIVLHVNLLYAGRKVALEALREEVENHFGPIPHAKYITRDGYLCEETILDEILKKKCDAVVMGRNQQSRWSKVLNFFESLEIGEEVQRLADDCEIMMV